MIGRRRIPVEERFWTKVNKTDTCWLWTASCNNAGYGQIWDEPRLVLVHRLAYEWEHGAIPDGLEVDHLCRIPACVNPTHLEAVTHRVNTLRGKNYSRGFCKRGHSLPGPLDGTPWQCLKCKELREKEKQRAIRIGINHTGVVRSWMTGREPINGD